MTQGDLPDFFDTFRVEDLFRFLVYAPRLDGYMASIPDYYRFGQGVDYSTMTISAVPSNDGTKGNMIDRDETTKWSSSGQITNGDQIDIALNSSVTISGFVIRSEANGFPLNFIIKYASESDYSDEATAYTGSIESDCVTVICGFAPQQARYWRIEVTENLAQTWDIFEILMYQGESNARNRIIGNATSAWSLSLGTIDDRGGVVAHSFNIPIMRLFDALNKLCDFAAQSNLRWEWWIDLDDQINFQTRRGSDKSGTISLEFGKHFFDFKWSRTIKNCVNRIEQFGSDWTKTDDGYRSGWREDTDKGDDYGVYEKVRGSGKDLLSDSACQLLGDIILTEAKTENESLEVEIRDSFAPNEFEVGDDVNVTVSKVDLNDTFRIKKKIVTVSGSGGTKIRLILGETGKYRSYKDFTDRLAWIKKRVIEADLRLPW